MSYEIYYKKCNIKLSDNTIIPYSLHGSNNCYDIARNGGNGRRARSWYSTSFWCGGKPSATEEEIRENVRKYIENYYLQKVRSTDEYDKSFREEFKSFPQFLEASSQYWFSIKIPGGKIKNMLSYFSAPTITIQELFWQISSIRVMTYKENYITALVNTEEELIDKLREGYSIAIYENEMTWALKSIEWARPKTPRIKKPQNFAFVILYGGAQVVSYRGTGFKFTQWGTWKHFKTEALAQKVMEQLQKNKNARQGFEIKRVEGTFTF